MEEISLRDCIQVLINQKRVIAVITILALLISIVISFFILPPVYESKVILMASSIDMKEQLPQQAEGVANLLNKLSEYPTMSLETYKEQINSPQVLQQTIDELKLGEYNITTAKLKDMITLNTIKDTNLITISIKYTDKKVAADIANTIARKFTDFVSTKAQEQAGKSSNYIKQQMDVEKSQLDQVLLEYKKYLSQPRGLNELQKEVDSKLELITKYKSDLLDAQIEEQKTSASLAAAQQQLKSTPEKITVNRSLVDEPYMSQAAKDVSSKNSTELFGVKVQAEEVNESYTALMDNINNLKVVLAQTVAKKNSLQEQISNLQKDLETLQVDLAGRQHEDTIIQEKVKFAQDTYNAFLEKYEEIRIAKSSAIGDASIIIISSAVEPLTIVAPNKKMNVAIAGVLGVMLSVFIAFFKEYWINTDPKVKKGVTF